MICDHEHCWELVEGDNLYCSEYCEVTAEEEARREDYLVDRYAEDRF